MDLDLDRIADEHRFSGVIGVERDGDLLTWASGYADRAHGIANTPTHRFGIASGTKTLTAIAVLSAIDDGAIDPGAPVRALLGDDLPLVDDRVTVQQLLEHRSGIGDYYDEDADIDIFDYVMDVPLHTLHDAEGYLAALPGRPQKFEPGTDFSYCNSGYVLLGILLERATGTAYHDAVGDRVTEPAGMTQTQFLRTDELPSDAAIGYLHPEGLRTNVLHLPVAGFGDGGVFTTVGDVHRLWAALASDRLGTDMLRRLVTPPVPGAIYGIGMWLDERPGVVRMVGGDAGVAFTSTRLASGTTFTVMANTTSGAGPVHRHLADALGDT